MTLAADQRLSVFDRGGDALLSSLDNGPTGIVGGMTRGGPADDLGEDLAGAENSRPTLPEETFDGLDGLEEAVRRRCEDLPLTRLGAD